MSQNLLSPTSSAEQYVTAEEIGSRFHLHPDTVAGWTRKYSDLPHTTLPNGSLRFRLSEVEAWLKKFNREVVNA